MCEDGRQVPVSCSCAWREEISLAFGDRPKGQRRLTSVKLEPREAPSLKSSPHLLPPNWLAC